ncbi:O-antigen ligase family protein [Sorangium cellulosum]|uniref:O-antigen ligase family protein n=1 Tax=Sorangium cellulosum TaxID=56 RepID=UPI000CF4E2A8|nr:O-antigen ligase family protein [Sorangium cellulosum]
MRPRSPAERRRSAGAGARRRASAPLSERAVPWLLGATILGSVLAIGAVHTPTLAIVSLVTAVAAALSLRASALGADRQPYVTALPTIALLALTAYTLLQAVPLPLSWLARLAPASADVWSRALMPLGEAAPRYGSLSLDPGATLVEATKWLTYAGVFVTAVFVGARHGARLGITLVFGSAFLAALTTIVHGLLGATHVFGVYEPRFSVAAWHVGPLLNPNNLAGYLNLGVLSGVGLLLTSRPILPAWVTGVGLTAIVGVGIIASSRAGLLVLPLGLALFALLAWRRRKRMLSSRRGSGTATWLLSLAISGGALLAALATTNRTLAEVADDNINKLWLFHSTIPLLADHWLFGVGRGAFETVFPAYRQWPGNIVFTHPENFVVQWAAEWGAPAAAAALVALGFAFRPGKLALRASTTALGAWVGCMVLLAQNLVDLGLEVPGVTIALVATLGSLWGEAYRERPLREAPPDDPGSARRAWLLPACAAASGATLVALMVGFGWRDVDHDRRELRAMSEAGAASGGWPRFRGELRAAMLRHPAEPYFPLLGAVVALQSRSESPIPWLQRTLERSRRHGRAHLLLAEVLASRGIKEQALLSLRLAVEDDPEVITTAAALARQWTQRWDELQRAVPEGEAGAEMLERMAVAWDRQGDMDLRLRCAEEAIARDPGRIKARWAVGDTLLAMLEDPSPTRCGGAGGAEAQRAACERQVEAHAAAIQANKESSFLAVHLRARLLLLRGKSAEAEQLLAGSCERLDDRISCLRLRVQAASQVPSSERLPPAIRDLLSATCSAPASCAAAATWAGDLLAARREYSSAVTHYARAAQDEPTEERLLKLADAAGNAGAHVQAAEALERVLHRRGGQDPELRKRIFDEKAKALSPSLTP